MRKWRKLLSLQEGKNLISKSKRNKGKLEWDQELSKKNINIQTMLDILFEIPKDALNNKKEGAKIRNLKKLKALVLNHMLSVSHKARFVFQEISDEDNIPPENEIIGSIQKAKHGKDNDSDSGDSDATEYYYQHVIHKNPGLLTIEQLQNAMNKNDLFSLEML
jgi:hypothetical protein